MGIYQIEEKWEKKTSSVLTMQQILPVGPVSDNSFPEPQIIALKGLTTFLKWLFFFKEISTCPILYIFFCVSAEFVRK